MGLMQSTGLTITNKQANIQASKQTNRHVELVEGGAGAYGADVVDGACRWVHI